jgi:hypothetical protein
MENNMALLLLDAEGREKALKLQEKMEALTGIVAPPLTKRRPEPRCECGMGYCDCGDDEE